MRIIAVTNQKGGSGKTTTAVNVAATLGELHRRVLVLDLDPQASATFWLGVSDGGRSLLDALSDRKPLELLVQASTAPGVDLIASSAWMVAGERSLAAEPGAEMILRRAIEQLPTRWDYVLIDCPPSLSFLAVSALASADEVLVPVEAHVMAYGGLAALLQTVERVRERLNPDLAVSAILACRVTHTAHAREVVERLRQRFGDVVLEAVVRENVRLAEAPSFQQPITTYDTRSRGAADYRAVASELEARHKRAAKRRTA